MNKNKWRKRFGIICVCFAILWCVMGFIDYWRVCHSFEKPIFTLIKETFDDGGSGTYKGLGYSFEIKGNFMPEDEFPGVTYAEYYLFGINVKNVIRD